MLVIRLPEITPVSGTRASISIAGVLLWSISRKKTLSRIVIECPDAWLTNPRTGPG